LKPASSFDGLGYCGEFLYRRADTKGTVFRAALSREGRLLPSYLADFFAAVFLAAAGLAAVFLAAAGLAAAVFLAAAGFAAAVFLAAAGFAAALFFAAAGLAELVFFAAAFGAAVFLAGAAFFAAAFGAAFGAAAFLAAGLAAVDFLAGDFEALFVAVAICFSPFDSLPDTSGVWYSVEVTPQHLGCQDFLHPSLGMA
jgi:hypothetical protein